MATVAPHTAFGNISPELVLVDPELREAALRALPDRPWEMYLPVGILESVPAAQVADTFPALAPALAAPRSALREPPPALADPPRGRRVAARPVPEQAGRPWRRRARTLVVLAAVVAGIANLGAWESGGEQLVSPVGATPRPPSIAATTPAYRSGAYIIGERGWLRTGKHGRAILELHLPVFCKGAQVAVGRVPIRADGRFRFAGVARMGARFHVTLGGRFRTKARAHGSVVVRGPGCPSRKASFVARLS